MGIFGHLEQFAQRFLLFMKSHKRERGIKFIILSSTQKSRHEEIKGGVNESKAVNRKGANRHTRKWKETNKREVRKKDDV